MYYLYIERENIYIYIYIYTYSLREGGGAVCLHSNIPCSRAIGPIVSTTFPKTLLLCEVSMAHLRTFKNTLCKRISVRHGGSKISQMGNCKV